MSKSTGFTLTETLVVLVIVSIILSSAMTSFANMQEKYRLKSAAQFIESQIQFTRIESIKRNQRIRLSFSANNTTQWSYGLTDEVAGTDSKKGCNPIETDENASQACTLEYDNDLTQDYNQDGQNTDTILYRFDQANYPQVIMTGKTRDYPTFSGGAKYATFNPIRGTTTAGTIELSSDNFTVRVVLSLLGRIRICSPQGDKKLSGYSDC